MQKIDLKQGFPHGFSMSINGSHRIAMQNPKRLSDLLSGPGNRLSALKTRSAERAQLVDQVRACLPARLAAAVVSAGIEQGKMTIGVVGAVWASRLRYLTESIRKQVAKSTGSVILTVKVRVVVPPPSL